MVQRHSDSEVQCSMLSVVRLRLSNIGNLRVDLHNKCSDGQWVAQLADLADISKPFNVLNLGLQRPSMTAFDLCFDWFQKFAIAGI